MYQPKMIIKIIEWNSSAYQAMIGLRKTVLLEPIGVPVTYIQPLNEKNDVFIAAFVNNEIVGCCVLTPGENKNVQLRQMAVATHLQGKGMGASILQFAEQTAKEMGYTRLLLHARNPVIPFYEKCGYATVGSEFFEVGIGHHKMEKKMVNTV